MLNDYESLRKVGDNIRKERKSQGLTLLEMHLRSGVDSKNLGKIEKGNNFTVCTLLRIACALDVEPDTLLKPREDTDVQHPKENGSSEAPAKTVRYWLERWAISAAVCRPMYGNGWWN